MECKKYKGQDYFLYDSIDEFILYKHLGATVKPWRDDSVKEGDYVETDEGGITKCLKVSYLKGKRCITTVCGTYRTDLPTHIMKNVVTDYPSKFVPIDGSRKSRNKTLTRKDKTFVRMTMLGEDEIKAYKKLHPDAKCEVYIKKKISTITNKRGYQEYMSDTFKKLLIDSDMTKEWALDIQKKIAEDKNSPAHVRVQITDNILADHGERQQKTTKEIHSWHASSQISSGELSEVKKIGEKVEKEIPNEE